MRVMDKVIIKSTIIMQPLPAQLMSKVENRRIRYDN